MKPHSITETLGNIFRNVADNEPKPPLHVGEVMQCWTYLALLDESRSYLQVGLNTTEDPELRDALQKSLDQCSMQVQRFTTFMIQEGISLPPSSESKPKSDPQAIPLGVKLTDEELANGISVKTASAILMCASGITQGIRTDLGLIWVETQMEKITFAYNMRTLMRKRGWLKIPPAFLPPGTSFHRCDT